MRIYLSTSPSGNIALTGRDPAAPILIPPRTALSLVAILGEAAAVAGSGRASTWWAGRLAVLASFGRVLIFHRSTGCGVWLRADRALTLARLLPNFIRLARLLSPSPTGVVPVGEGRGGGRGGGVVHACNRLRRLGWRWVVLDPDLHLGYWQNGNRRSPEGEYQTITRTLSWHPELVEGPSKSTPN